MAKLKLAAYAELIEIPNEKAKQLKKLWMDDSVENDEKISVGDSVFLKGQIKAIFLDGEEKKVEDLAEKRLREYNAREDAFLLLSPEEKAQRRAWGHFGLFYRAIFGERPKEEELKERVIKEAIIFYTKNPKRWLTDMDCWAKLLRVEYGVKMDGTIKRLLYQIEKDELVGVEQNKEYRVRKEQRELQEVAAEFSNELPF